MTDSFYLYLPSNSLIDDLKRNTPATYRTILSRPLYVQGGKWEAALVEIQYLNAFDSVRESHNKIYYKDGQFWDFARIQSGSYTNVDQLTKQINETEPFKSKNISFVFSSITQKITIKYPDGLENYSMYLTGDLADICGFESDFIITQTSEAKYHANIHAGKYSIFVYSDLITNSFVGNSESPLARVIPILGTPGEYVRQQFTNLQYIPLSRDTFESVAVELRHDDGELLKASRGKTVCVFHLRIKQPFIGI